MIMLRALFAAAAAFAATGGLAEAPLELEPEQAVVLQIEPSGDYLVTGISRAEWTPFDVAAARHLAGQTPPQVPQTTAEPLTADIMPEPPQLPPGQVAVRFMAIAGRHALLVVENGYDQALVYRARMSRNGQTRSTDVCVVPPRLGSYEHWPHPIERLTLSDFRLVPWREGQEVTCH
jgi:hypothetical protein